MKNDNHLLKGSNHSASRYLGRFAQVVWVKWLLWDYKIFLNSLKYQRWLQAGQ